MTTERRPPKKELTPRNREEAFVAYLSQWLNSALEEFPQEVAQQKKHMTQFKANIETGLSEVAKFLTANAPPEFRGPDVYGQLAQRIESVLTSMPEEEETPAPVEQAGGEGGTGGGATTAGVLGLAASEAEEAAGASAAASASGIAAGIATTPLSMEGLTPDTINQKINTQLQLLNSPDLAKSISDAAAKEKATGKVIPDNLIQAANLLKQSDETQREVLTKAALAQAVQQWAISNLELDPTSLTRIATDSRTGIPVQSLNANSPMDKTIAEIVDDIYGQYNSSPIEGGELTRLSIPKSLEAPMFNDAFDTMVGSGKPYTQALKVMTRASPESQASIFGKRIFTGTPGLVENTLSNPTNLANFQQLLSQLFTESSIKATEMSEQYKQKGWNIPGSYFNMQDYALGMAAPPAFTKFFGEINKLSVNQTVPGTFAHLTDLVPGNLPKNFGSIIGLGGFGPVGGAPGPSGRKQRIKRFEESEEDEELMWQQLSSRVLGQQQPTQPTKPRKTTSL